MVTPITYYIDKECKKRYPVNETGQAIIDWGISVPGEKKIKELYAKNESRDRAVFRQPYSIDKDLTITDYPTNLMAKEVGIVTLSFEPKKERIDAMHSSWGFDIIIG